MKINFRLLYLSIIISFMVGCGPKTQDHSGHDMGTTDENGNQALYNQVMDIHDEVMPKTETLYNLGKELKAKLSETKSDEEKQQLQKRIAYIDSVNGMMMNWMHDFSPPTDTTGDEAVRAYYETQLEQVKKVREAILLAIEKEGK